MYYVIFWSVKWIGSVHGKSLLEMYDHLWRKVYMDNSDLVTSVRCLQIYRSKCPFSVSTVAVCHVVTTVMSSISGLAHKYRMVFSRLVDGVGRGGYATAVLKQSRNPLFTLTIDYWLLTSWTKSSENIIFDILNKYVFIVRPQAKILTQSLINTL